MLNILNEHQICRIDRYLGKEEVQNILVLLFANGMFENRGAEPPVSAISLIAMEPPKRFDARNVRSEKDEVLAAIQPQSEENALKNSFSDPNVLVKTAAERL